MVSNPFFLLSQLWLTDGPSCPLNFLSGYALLASYTTDNCLGCFFSYWLSREKMGLAQPHSYIPDHIKVAAGWPLHWPLMDWGLSTSFLCPKSSIALVLKIGAMSRVDSSGGKGGHVVTETSLVNTHKESLWLHGEHQLFIKHLIGTGHCSSHWDTVINMADKTITCIEPAGERDDDKKKREKIKQNIFRQW